MKNIEKISNLIPYEGFSQIQTAFLLENNISPEMFEYCFPDYGCVAPKIGEFLKSMSRLNGTVEFIDFISNNREKKFIVVGDYDCDGVFSTIIMVEGLRAVGCNCDFIVPHKFNDGYGLRQNHVDKAIEMGADVIITVDNGISCKDAVEYARKKGIDVIITDHHNPGENIPEGVIIINPKYNGDFFPEISGGFVALKVVNDLIWELSEKIETDYTTVEGTVKYQTIDKNNFFLTYELAFFAAITTISDLMPLIGENRLLVKAALAYANNLKEKNVWAGKVMKVVSGLGGYSVMRDSDKLINEDTFKFFTGPTVNAVGRVDGDVEPLIRDILNLSQHGVYLNNSEYYQKNNTRRQNTRVLLSKLEENDDPVNVVLFDSSDYDFEVSGLIGLVASRLSDSGKVSLVGFEKDGLYEFSCRSVKGYSIFDGFNRIKESFPELLLEGGGHDLSMGIRLGADLTSLETFKNALIEDVKNNYVEYIENFYEFEPEMLDELIYEHQQFGLFGGGFKKLVFTYNAPFISYNNETKTAQIGDFYFKTGKPASLEINSNVQVDFIISLESKSQIIFKVERLHWDSENKEDGDIND